MLFLWDVLSSIQPWCIGDAAPGSVGFVALCTLPAEQGSTHSQKGPASPCKSCDDGRLLRSPNWNVNTQNFTVFIHFLRPTFFLKIRTFNNISGFCCQCKSSDWVSHSFVRNAHIQSLDAIKTCNICTQTHIRLSLTQPIKHSCVSTYFQFSPLPPGSRKVSSLTWFFIHTPRLQNQHLDLCRTGRQRHLHLDRKGDEVRGTLRDLDVKLS